SLNSVCRPASRSGIGCAGPHCGGPGDDPDEMLREDPPALPDDEGMVLTEMTAVDQELGGRAVEVRAGVGHDAVGPPGAGRITAVGDDRVILRRRLDPHVA